MKAIRALFSGITVVLVVVALAQTAPSAIAVAEEAHHEATAEHAHGGEHDAPGLDQLLLPAINFAIYLFIIVRFVIPAMREFLRRRHSGLVQSQAAAAAALTRAEAELAVSNARLAGIEAEAEGIRQDLITIANRQSERLKAQAEETGARRLADAALLAEQERRRAMANLRRELALAASRIAEERVRSALTPDDQRSFVQAFLKEASTR